MGSGAGASFRAEALKLRGRPATWILALVLVLTVVLFGYFFTYIFVANAPRDSPPAPAGFARFLLPESFLSNVLNNGIAGFGSALALILGAMSMGSEYGWETLKVALTQRPGRQGFFAGKLLGLGAVLLGLVLLAFAVGAASSAAVAALEGSPAEWPAVGEILQAVGAGWLILATFAAFGIFLATLFRGTALAIGLGLAYLLVLENLFLGLSAFNQTVENIGRAFPAKNSVDLAGSFGKAPAGLGLPGQAVDGWQAALVLGAYTLGFLLLAVLLFRRRDVA